MPPAGAGAVPPPLPIHVYKILPSAPPEPLPSTYPLSELDQKDGFVHLSTASQIPITASRWFKDSTDIWILKLKLARFENNTDWAVPGCPHLYGNFGAEDVVDSRKFTRKDDEDWWQVFKAEGSWLE